MTFLCLSKFCQHDLFFHSSKCGNNMVTFSHLRSLFQCTVDLPFRFRRPREDGLPGDHPRELPPGPRRPPLHLARRPEPLFRPLELRLAPRHGCQMAIARFLDRMCLALPAFGLWLRYATLQNLIPSFPWIVPGWRAGAQSKGGLYLANL